MLRWRLIMYPCSFVDLRKDAQVLLALINTLPATQWQQRLHQIFIRDPVQGPLAVAWMCKQMMKAGSHKSILFWRSQIDACKHAARASLKVRCGWESYGMTPYEVRIHRGYFKKQILPRYHSEPNLPGP